MGGKPIIYESYRQLREENERLRNAIEAIQKATLEGRVCDNVAWFDSITTLHDFCELTLHPDSRIHK